MKQGGTHSTVKKKNWVSNIEMGTPASEAGIKLIQILESGVIDWSDAIAAVGGNEVATSDELRPELEDHMQGEKVAFTLEDLKGERTV